MGPWLLLLLGAGCWSGLPWTWRAEAASIDAAWGRAAAAMQASVGAGRGSPGLGGPRPHLSMPRGGEQLPRCRRRWVLVGAPLDLEGRGRIYRCRVGESSCRDAGVGGCWSGLPWTWRAEAASIDAAWGRAAAAMQASVGAGRGSPGLGGPRPHLSMPRGGEQLPRCRRRWVLVGAPLDLEGRGRIYRCRVGESSCRDAGVGDRSDLGPMALGMSVAANGSQLLVGAVGCCGALTALWGLWGSVGHHGSLWGTVALCGVQACGPAAQRTCGVNAEVPGFCFLQFSGRSETTTLQACPTSTSDIVFLIDGSGSVAPFDFERMKTFITEVITRFRGTDTRLHVSFSDFDVLSEAALQRKVLRVEQQGGITQTATAIRYVLTDVFPRSRAGAHRVLLVVTDGQIYGDNLRYRDVIPEADRDGVIRYAIGVGSAFRSPDAAQELHTIASPPSHAHVFRVDNFEALRGIQEQLQEKIFAIEGTAVGRPHMG
ncbi:UNVERIFIED_CONTAM: hypothetical protein H355_009922 [Colinus virginianus]|nr:hypothetical protein H355_009922 [Colinus virginianus]